jgi:phenylpyruvate tautomerase PptA (4-oxalocrotonate tautomerase family)
MPYLHVTCPAIDEAERRTVAETLTSALVELFTPPRGPRSVEIRARTTVQFACYRLDELFVGGVAASSSRADVTAELSDWHMSTRQQHKAAAALTPVLVRLFDAEPGSVNIRFHSYPPTDFAVGGQLLSDRIPAAARFAKRVFG